MAKSTQRLIYIDTLRAISILYIIGIWHIDDYANGCFYSPITQLAAFGALNIFVYISSFILTCNHQSILSATQFKEFIWKRIIRIYPLYLITIIIFFVMFHIPWIQLLASVLLIDMITNSSVFTLWFIGMIFNYYILISLILYKFTWKRFVTISMLFVFLSFILFMTTDLIDKRLLLYYPAFALGISSAKNSKIRSYFENNIFSLVMVLFVLASISLYYLHFANNRIGTLILFFGGICTIIPSLTLSKKLSSYLNLNIIKKLSYASFCMYLFHRIIYSMVLQVFHPKHDASTLFLLAIVGLPVIYYFAYFIQRNYDKLIIYLTGQSS
jgi:peptidoglycan/LPS O-acetylase OafA/YrhL